MTSPLMLEPTYEATRQLGPWLAARLALPDATAFVDRVGEIELAVHEVVTNVIDHAVADTCSAITVAAAVEDDQLVITSVDPGEPFHHEAYVAPVDGMPQVRGYGLMIVEQLALSCTYTRSEEAGTNTWTVIFAPSA